MDAAPRADGEHARGDGRRVTRAASASARRAGAWIVACWALGACASPGSPPGGPEDRTPPKLLGVTPDTGTRNARPREVVFRFDEVVSETPRGAGVGGAGGGGTAGAGAPLSPLVLLSPRSGAVEVEWHREEISVRPRRGFRPNTTYTVTLLPGLADLRDNVRDTAIVTVFSTGDAIARGRVGGVVFDWVSGRPAGGAIVEAIAPDSTVFFALADSVGRFVIPNLPTARYQLKGVLDLNSNRSVDPREAFDTATVDAPIVARGDTAAVELYAFSRDTVGVRLQNVTVRDSVTLRLTFDRPLLPTQLPTIAQVRLLAGDSSVVPLAGLYTSAAFDSLAIRRQRQAADSAARARPDTASARTRAIADSVARQDSLARIVRATRDSLAAVRAGRRPSRPAPVPSRPTPPTELVVVLQAPLQPQTGYRLSVRDVVGLTRRPRSSERVFNTPRAAPPPPARPDSTRPAPAGTPPASAPARPPADSTARRPPRR